MKKTIIPALLLLFLAGCSGRDDLSDAYGNFETIEYLISAEGNGKILALDLQEGDVLSAGQVVGYYFPLAGSSEAPPSPFSDEEVQRRRQQKTGR